VCCFRGVCLLGGANGVYRLKCYGGGDGCCNGGLISAFRFAFVITFLRMLLLFILLLWWSMWFKKDLWDHKCEILLCFATYVSKKKSLTNGKYHFALSPMWIEEKPLASQQVCMSFPFLFCMNKKKTNYGLANVQDPFYSSHAWIEKTICGLASVQYHFFSSLLWVKKTMCRLTNVQYHSFFTYVNKEMICRSISVKTNFLIFNYMGSQVCNIIIFSLMYIKKIICMPVCVKHIFLYSLTWVKKPLESLQESNILCVCSSFYFEYYIFNVFNVILDHNHLQWIWFRIFNHL
jgi:hypothetical protein